MNVIIIKSEPLKSLIITIATTFSYPKILFSVFLMELRYANSHL